MFKRLPEAAGQAVGIVIDGRAFEARVGDSVAAALLAAGITQLRITAGAGAPRGPYCMMGACSDCVVTIDGIHDRQSCQVTVREGMQIGTQRAVSEGGS